MVSRIATFLQSTSLAQDLSRLQTQYAQGEEQMSSGLTSDNYQGIATSTKRLLSLESQYSSLASQSANAQTALDRVNSMSNSVQSMENIINSFMSSLSAAISTTGNDASSALSSSASQALQEFSSLLNSQQAGRYLFGGSVTDKAPVDLSDPNYTTPTVPSSANTAYYQGNDQVASVQASDNLSISYGVTADDPAFEQALRAFSLVTSDPTNQSALTEAYNLLSSSNDSLATMDSSLATKASTLDTQINDNTDDLNLLDNMIGDIKNVDMSALSIKLSQLETQLEASYSLTSSILKLNLSNYL